MNPVSHAEGLKLLKKAKKVFVFVRHMTEDGMYFEMPKASAIRQFACCPFTNGEGCHDEQKVYNVQLTDDGMAFIN